MRRRPPSFSFSLENCVLLCIHTYGIHDMRHNPFRSASAARGCCGASARAFVRWWFPLLYGSLAFWRISGVYVFVSSFGWSVSGWRWLASCMGFGDWLVICFETRFETVASYDFTTDSVCFLVCELLNSTWTRFKHNSHLLPELRTDRKSLTVSDFTTPLLCVAIVELVRYSAFVVLCCIISKPNNSMLTVEMIEILWLLV